VALALLGSTTASGRASSDDGRPQRATHEGIAISQQIARQAEDQGFDYTTWCECMVAPPLAVPAVSTAS